MIFFRNIISDLKRKYAFYGFSFLIMSVVSSYAMACICPSENNNLGKIFSEAKGIYLVAISAIYEKKTRSTNGRINLELKVLKVFKGESVPQLVAVGYADLPTINLEGDIIESNRSCDMKYVYGSQYIVVEKNNEKIILAKCSDSVIGLEKLAALTVLTKNK